MLLVRHRNYSHDNFSPSTEPSAVEPAEVPADALEAVDTVISTSAPVEPEDDVDVAK